MELYLIRHGQSYNNAVAEYETMRVQDPELTEIGHRQAHLVADFLATTVNLEDIALKGRNGADLPRYCFSHLYCSPMHRALQTARPIADALNMNCEVWVDIHEEGGIWLRQNGKLQGFGGRTRTQIAEEFPKYLVPETITDLGWYKPENGAEDITLCHARAMRVARDLKARAASEATQRDQIAIVSHATFMDSLIKALTGMLPGDNFRYWHYNTAITRFDIQRDGRVIMRYQNRVTHLPPELIT